MALIGSEETLEIARREGSAAKALAASAGEPVSAYRAEP
jgi:S-adenosylmethionine hydrolase